MDPIKLLAAIVFKLRDENDQVLLTPADAQAAIVMDRTNLRVTPGPDGLRLQAISQADAEAEQRAQQVRQNASSLRRVV